MPEATRLTLCPPGPRERILVTEISRLGIAARLEMGTILSFPKESLRANRQSFPNTFSVPLIHGRDFKDIHRTTMAWGFLFLSYSPRCSREEIVQRLIEVRKLKVEATNNQPTRQTTMTD